jgi:hypothetical protein
MNIKYIPTVVNEWTIDSFTQNARLCYSIDLCKLKECKSIYFRSCWLLLITRPIVWSDKNVKPIDKYNDNKSKIIVLSSFIHNRWCYFKRPFFMTDCNLTIVTLRLHDINIRLNYLSFFFLPLTTLPKSMCMPWV